MARPELLEKHDLLDIIKDEFELKTDRDLAHFLEIQNMWVNLGRNG